MRKVMMMEIIPWDKYSLIYLILYLNELIIFKIYIKRNIITIIDIFGIIIIKFNSLHKINNLILIKI